MTTGSAKIANDEEHYLWLCKKFNEEPQTSKGARGCRFYDCYGKHSHELQIRFNKHKTLRQ